MKLIVFEFFDGFGLHVANNSVLIILNALSDNPKPTSRGLKGGVSDQKSRRSDVASDQKHEVGYLSVSNLRIFAYCQNNDDALLYLCIKTAFHN